MQSNSKDEITNRLQIDLERDFAAGVYLSEAPLPPPLLSFFLGWSSNFVGSESGQKQC